MRRALPERRLHPRLTRRGLLGGGLLAGVLAAAGVSVAARGGTLRLAVAGPLPGPWEGAALLPLVEAGLAEGLVAAGPGGTLLPGLALSWEGGGRDWRLALDPAARFHDGRPVTARDAAASLDRAGFEAEARAEGGALRLRLPAPDPSLPLRLLDPALAVWPGGRPGPVGSGPYRLDSAGAPPWRLRRAEGHPRGAALAHFDAVALLPLPDPEARLAALLGREADAAPLPESLRGAARAAGLRLAEGVAHRPGLVAGGARPATAWWWAA